MYILPGGWVGYFSYDTVRYVEKKKLPFSSAPTDDRNLPDVHLGLYDDVIVFDHVNKVDSLNLKYVVLRLCVAIFLFIYLFNYHLKIMTDINCQ